MEVLVPLLLQLVATDEELKAIALQEGLGLVRPEDPAAAPGARVPPVLAPRVVPEQFPQDALEKTRIGVMIMKEHVLIARKY